jgi:hypothetical protein
VGAADAFNGFNRAVDELFGGDPVSALATIDDALGALPGDRNMRFVRSGALAGSGDVDASMTELRALVAEHPPFEVIIRSFVAKGLIALPEGVSIDVVLG